MAVVYLPTESLTEYERNARTHSEFQVGQIVASIREFGWTNPLLVDDQHQVIAGHGRLRAAKALGLDRVPCICIGGLSEVQQRALVLADNKLALNAGWDDALLASELQALGSDELAAVAGFSADEMVRMLGLDEAGSKPAGGSLAGAFMVPPFSVLNAREGWWQERKRAWLALGIRSELGRGGEMNATPPHPPTVTQNADGTLNYSGTVGQAQRFDAQRQPRRPNAEPGGSARPAADYSRRERGDGRGKAMTK